MIKTFKIIVKKFFKFVLGLIIFFVVWGILSFSVRTLFFEATFLRGVVEGGLTGVHENQYVLVDKISYKFRSPKVGEIIIYKSSLNPADRKFSRVSNVLPDGVMIRGEKWPVDWSSQFVSRENFIGRILSFPTPLTIFLFVSFLLLNLVLSIFLTLFIFRLRCPSKK